MGVLDDIRQRLLSGSTPSQLIKEGYAKSSVNHAAKKLKKSQPDALASPIPDEIKDLRQQREKIKLQKEIAELEAGKEKLSERVATLEKTISELRSFVTKAVEAALWQSLVSAGEDREEAKEFSDGWVDRHIKWGNGQ